MCIQSDIGGERPITFETVDESRLIVWGVNGRPSLLGRHKGSSATGALQRHVGRGAFRQCLLCNAHNTSCLQFRLASSQLFQLFFRVLSSHRLKRDISVLENSIGDDVTPPSSSLSSRVARNESPAPTVSTASTKNPGCSTKPPTFAYRGVTKEKHLLPFLLDREYFF